MQLTGHTILITGGTSGIGRALAEAFHQRGNRVIIAGRRRALLDEISATHPGICGLQVDMQNAASVASLAEEVRSLFPDLDVLVNNAGISREETWDGDVIDIDTSLSIIETNVLGVLRVTAALLPTLAKQPSATIITTTSGLAFVPRFNYPTYCASKAFLHSWLQSLRHQLRHKPIDVIELPPPYVQTELSGPQHLSDPAAMPLGDYIAEVVALLGEPTPDSGEILVERVKAQRMAERSGVYAQIYAKLNPA
ncbi:SDR family oxidoreductase [Plastoroseomonas hellenica]|uniref:SDR family oxidoreductase n=1 Tax=Plastoroseomonas hellenica TaxID=2687306 RepID=UPI001BA7410B|nr:SDR family NAD(P)-dependent oxidoreductase [Plastoroseomonas hellenica]MBR0642695.1 SDR family NAD(P)-dependent oxidoreductase [Plastoroseomonas hellenica]